MYGDVAVIVPGQVHWKPIEPRGKCEIGDCSNASYKVCNDRIRLCCCCSWTLWKGCQRRMCVQHTELHFNYVDQATLNEETDDEKAKDYHWAR